VEVAIGSFDPLASQPFSMICQAPSPPRESRRSCVRVRPGNRVGGPISLASRLRAGRSAQVGEYLVSKPRDIDREAGVELALGVSNQPGEFAVLQCAAKPLGPVRGDTPWLPGVAATSGSSRAFPCRLARIAGRSWSAPPTRRASRVPKQTGRVGRSSVRRLRACYDAIATRSHRRPRTVDDIGGCGKRPTPATRGHTLS
jgi:hypothetical protein